MKKFMLIALVSLLALKANTAEALEARCNALVEIQPKIQEIHEFLTIATSVTPAEYDAIVSKLNNDTNAIALKVVGCDKYTDNLVAQMHGALTYLVENSGKYRGVKSVS